MRPAMTKRSTATMRSQLPARPSNSPEWYVWLAASGFLTLLPACASILDIPDSPKLADDARDSGMQADAADAADAGEDASDSGASDTGPWACLSDPPGDPSVETRKATVRVYTCEFVDDCESPVTGLTGKLCLKRDVGCTNPVKEGLQDEDGTFMFDIDLPTDGFDGYMEISAAPASCTDTDTFGSASESLCGLLPDCDTSAPDENCMVPTYATALVFFNPPVRASMDQPLPVPMLSTPALPAIVGAAGAPLDPTRGNLFITAVDCDGTPASGVTYGISDVQDEVTPLYVKDGVVSDSSFETDASGIGGFVGVPPGFAEVTGYNADLDEIGSIGVQAAPFSLTYSSLGPLP